MIIFSPIAVRSEKIKEVIAANCYNAVIVEWVVASLVRRFGDHANWLIQPFSGMSGHVLVGS